MIIILAVIMLVFSIATPVAADARSTALDRIRESGILKVGTAGDYQPMSYLDPQTGTYVGFDAELAEDLAASLGAEVVYVETSWPTLMDDTIAGKFDLAICGITITETRKEQALMSEGYLGNGKTVLCRREDAETYTSLEAINRPEVRVMENPGGLNEKFARENLPDATLIIHDVNQEIPGLVAAGEADVMITEIMEAGYYVGQDSRLAAPLIYDPFTRGELGVLMPKGSEDLLDYVNGFLEDEKTSGRIDELAEEYIYRYTKEEQDQAAYAGAVAEAKSASETQAEAQATSTPDADWTLPETIGITDEVTAVFDKALEGLTGVTYEPIGYLGEKDGVYCVLCRATVVYPDAKPYYALVYVSSEGMQNIWDIWMGAHVQRKE